MVRMPLPPDPDIPLNLWQDPNHTLHATNSCSNATGGPTQLQPTTTSLHQASGHMCTFCVHAAIDDTDRAARQRAAAETRRHLTDLTRDLATFKVATRDHPTLELASHTQIVSRPLKTLEQLLTTCQAALTWNNNRPYGQQLTSHLHDHTRQLLRTTDKIRRQHTLPLANQQTVTAAHTTIRVMPDSGGLGQVPDHLYADVLDDLLLFTTNHPTSHPNQLHRLAAETYVAQLAAGHTPTDPTVAETVHQVLIDNITSDSRTTTPPNEHAWLQTTQQLCSRWADRIRQATRQAAQEPDHIMLVSDPHQTNNLLLLSEHPAHRLVNRLLLTTTDPLTTQVLRRRGAADCGHVTNQLAACDDPNAVLHTAVSTWDGNLGAATSGHDTEVLRLRRHILAHAAAHT